MTWKADREKRAWYDMRSRCRNPHKAGSYGGFAVDQAWDSFARFVFDVGFAPSPQHTLERMDNARGYEPGNVRWATKQEQARNRRTNRVLNFNGQARCIAEWAEHVGVAASVLYARAELGWSDSRILTAPLRRTNHA